MLLVSLIVRSSSHSWKGPRSMRTLKLFNFNHQADEQLFPAYMKRFMFEYQFHNLSNT